MTNAEKYKRLCAFLGEPEEKTLKTLEHAKSFAGDGVSEEEAVERYCELQLSIQPEERRVYHKDDEGHMVDELRKIPPELRPDGEADDETGNRQAPDIELDLPPELQHMLDEDGKQ